MRILLVDDDELVLDLITEMLFTMGYRDVTTATSAKEALLEAKLADTPYDCFLLDIAMPGGNGIQLCADLRALEVYKYVPIIMLTAMTDRHFIDDAFLAGASDYVNKPFNMENLEYRLQAALNQANRAKLRRAPAPELLYPDDTHFAEFDTCDYAKLLDKPCFISNRALKRYLERLWLVGKSCSGLVAVRLDLRGAVENEQSLDAVPDLTFDFASYLGASLREGMHLATYVGSGVFVLCAQVDSGMFSRGWRGRLRAGFARRVAKFEQFGIVNPRLEIGTFVEGSLSSDRKPLRILEQAISAPNLSTPGARPGA